MFFRTDYFSNYLKINLMPSWYLAEYMEENLFSKTLGDSIKKTMVIFFLFYKKLFKSWIVNLNPFSKSKIRIILIKFIIQHNYINYLYYNALFLFKVYKYETETRQFPRGWNIWYYLVCLISISNCRIKAECTEMHEIIPFIFLRKNKCL